MESPSLKACMHQLIIFLRLMFTMCPLLLLVFPRWLIHVDTMDISMLGKPPVRRLRRETDVAYEQELQQNPYSVRRAELMIADGIWGLFLLYRKFD